MLPYKLKGHFFIASSLIDIIVGIAINASRIEPVKAVNPVFKPKISFTSGAITTSPKNPSTTEGIPARISMNGFKNSLSPGVATSEIYTAPIIPKGIAIMVANTVTNIEPVIKG